MPAQVAAKLRRVRHVLDHLHVEDDVEALAGGRQIFRRRGAVVDVETLLGGMDGGRLDVPLRRVDGNHVRAQPRHRLGQQAAAAADVEKAQALERFALVWVDAQPRRHLLADIVEPDRIELVQHAELAVGVPPFGGHCGKAFHLGRVDGGAAGDVFGGLVHGFCGYPRRVAV